MEQLVLHGQFRLFWETAPRNIDRARRRWLRHQVAQNAEDIGPITLNGGTALQSPSDEEDFPEPPAGASPLHPPPGSYESSSDSDDSQGYGGRGRAAKCPGGRAGNQTPIPLNVLAPLPDKRRM